MLIAIGKAIVNSVTSIKMAVKRDSLGRRARKCRIRVHPLSEFHKKEFLARYRLSKKVVRMLVKKFQPNNSTKGLKNGGGLSHEDKFCLALRYFATGGLFSLVGDSQHVSKALVSRAVRDVSNYFYRNRQEYLKWPGTFQEKLEKAQKFYRHRKQRTPRVFAMVDGTHIPIKTPLINESCYVNYKNYHSINATIYADFDKRILNVDARFSGSVNDAYAFHCSPVGDLAKSGKLGKFIILGDSGYALKKNLFVPYKKPRTPKQRAFNGWHRRNRARVEHTIGILKQRFRCLDSASGYLYHTPQRSAKIVTACCCLHNIAMDHGLKITTHPNDPWVPTRARLRQPRQRSQPCTKEEIKKVRDAYCRKHF